MKASEISKLIGGELSGAFDPDLLRISSLESADENSLAFTTSKDSISSRAGCLIVPMGYKAEGERSIIRCPDPKLAFAQAAKSIVLPTDYESSISPNANIGSDVKMGDKVHVSGTASIGDGTSIGKGSVIMDGVRIGARTTIGANCEIHPNAVIGDDCVLGDSVVVHPSAVIGSEGFGFVRDGEKGYVKFPQIGRVLIGNEVEIGANTTVDRGALGDTVIGDGTKVDNLVQIAHNVRIGKRVVIAAQTGLAGSVTIEDDCVLAGQIGVGEGATIRAGSAIGGQAAIMPGKIVRKGVWWGSPIQQLDEYLEQLVELRSIKKLKSRVAELEDAIKKLLP